MWRASPRSNWTGTDQAIVGAGVPEAVHSLLSQAYCRAFNVVESQEDGGLGHVAADDVGGDLCDDDEAQPRAGADRRDDEAPASAAGEEPDEPSVWKEDPRDRVRSTREWFLSGRFNDDMITAQIMYSGQSTRMLKQLSMSGKRWEAKEQRTHTRTGRRRYQVVEAYKARVDMDLLKNGTSLAVDPSRWLPLGTRTEETQLLAYRLGARLCAATFELLYRPHRSWPYKLFGILDDDVVAAELLTERSCRLDPFSLSFREHYRERVAGSVACAELTALASVLDTDTSSTERWHSRNQRRANFRVWSHVQDFPSLSADFFAMRARDDLVSSCSHKHASDSGEKRRRVDKSQGLEGGDGQQRPRRTGGGGAWRAFLHRNADGRKLTADVVTELSVRYRNLNDQQRKYYVELGVLATIAKQQGELAFGRRIRRRAIGEAPPDPAARAALAVEPVAMATCLVPALSVAAKGGAGGAAQVARIVADATAAQQAGEAEREYEDHAALVDAVAIRKWSAAASVATEAGWALAASAPTHGALVGHWEQVPHALAILEHRPRATDICATLEQRTSRASSPSPHRAALWRAAHTAVLAKDCEPIGALGSGRRLCHEAQLCTCSAEGKLLRRLLYRFRLAFNTAKAALDKGAYAKLVRGGFMVLHVQSVDAGVGDAAAPAAGCAAPGRIFDEWLHIALMYMKPWRPTFVVMRRRPAGDSDECLGVEATLDAANPDLLALRTVWQLLGEIVASDAPVQLSWYRLVASARQVYAITPLHQRVSRLPTVESFVVWKGKTQERRRARRPQGAPRRAPRVDGVEPPPLVLEEEPAEPGAEPHDDSEVSSSEYDGGIAGDEGDVDGAALEAELEAVI